MTEIGPHLLGRKPSPPDTRDFRMADALQMLRVAHLAAPDSSYLDKTIREIIAEDKYVVAGRSMTVFESWLRKQAKAAQPTPVNPIPDPLPAARTVYPISSNLDQGNTGHCVGFGWTHFGNTAPIEDQYTDADANAFYYAIKADQDHEPNAEDGSTVRSGAQEMLKDARINGSYVFAANIGEIQAWLQTQGPVVFGTDWYEGMFTPDADGVAHMTGPVQGGHCFLACGIDLGFKQGPAFICQNSWGSSWGLDIDGGHGRFYLLISDMEKLLATQGEACAATEIPATELSHT